MKFVCILNYTHNYNTHRLESLDTFTCLFTFTWLTSTVCLTMCYYPMPWDSRVRMHTKDRILFQLRLQGFERLYKILQQLRLGKLVGAWVVIYWREERWPSTAIFLPSVPKGRCFRRQLQNQTVKLSLLFCVLDVKSKFCFIEDDISLDVLL